MQISKKEIETVKRSHDLMTVVSSYGVSLKKKGSNYVGLCPFHKEKTPSFTVNPRTNLYHCFGCNAGGDVIGFVTKQEGIGFREAFEKLGSAEARKSKDRGKGNGSNPVSTSTIWHTIWHMGSDLLIDIKLYPRFPRHASFY